MNRRSSQRAGEADASTEQDVNIRWLTSETALTLEANRYAERIAAFAWSRIVALAWMGSHEHQ